MTSAQPVVGVDIGGTRIKACTLSPDGETLADVVVPTPADIATTMAPTVADVVARLGPVAERPGAVGVVVPGYVDDAAGVGAWSANLGWRGLPIRDLVAAELQVPVRVGHDVRAGLLAEHYFGAARGVRDGLFVPIGTGIASALLSGGQVANGHPACGEIGHVVVDPTGPECGCGRRGCLEAIASARAIATTASRLVGERLTAVDVEERVRAGDEIATSVWHTAIDHLATVLAGAVTAAGVTHVIIGGGLVGAGEILLDPLRAALTTRLPRDYACHVAPAELGDRAGALGAAVLAFSELGLEPGGAR